MLSCQISLYPLAINDYDQIIVEALEEIRPFMKDGLTIDVGSMSTILKGPDRVVWQAVQAFFAKASEEGKNQLVLNMQVSNTCGCDI